MSLSRLFKSRITRRMGKALIVAVIAAMWSHTSLAQSMTGDLIGTVTDKNGAAIAGAHITIRNKGTGSSRKTTTDEHGEFKVASFPVAAYEMQVEAQGFASSQNSFDLTLGQVLTLNSMLTVSGVQEVVSIDTVSDAVQLGSSQLGGLIGRRQIMEVPLNGRNLDQLALLEPGVSTTTNRSSGGTIHGTQININGAGSRASRFLLDGTNVGDTFNNGIGSAVNTFLGIDAVQEFRVFTNSYTAEYGEVSGGVISIVTKSGTNAFHGSLFEFLRNDKLDARNFFDGEKPGFKRNQFGFSASGPVVKDRTFFFGSSEWLRERLGITKLTVVPSLDARRGRLPDPATPGQFITVNINAAALPYLNLFPEPNGRDFGTGLAELAFPFAQKTDESFYQLRVDHKLGSKNNLFARYTYDDADRNPPANFPAWTVVEKSTNQFLTLEDIHVVTNALVNTFRFSFARTNLFSNDTLHGDFPLSALLIPGRPEPQLSIGGMPTTGGGERPPRSSLQLQNLFSYGDDISLVKGKHILKWGALIDRAENIIETKSYLGGRFNFPGIQQFLQGRPSNLTIAAPDSDPRQDFFHTRFGAYLQDDYKLARNLTLNLGLRLEFSTVPTEKFGHIVGLPAPMFDSGVTVGQLYENQKQNWAPRIGMAWDPWGSGKTVIRSGFGIFYDINTIPFIAQKINGNPPFNNRLVVGNPGLTPNLSAVLASIDLGLPAFNWQTPHALHYNLAVERELAPGTVATLAFAGSRGINLVRTGEVNSPIPQILPDGRAFFLPNAPRRNPKIGAISLIRPDGNSWYNAMQLKVVSRLGSVFRVQGSYTFSRTIDESQGVISGDAFGSQSLAWNPDDRSFDRGLADFHRKHNFVANWTWSMPFFRNKGGFVEAALGGWGLDGIITVLSGNPFTPGIQADFTGTRFASDARGIDRPNLKPGFSADNIIKGGPDKYFDASAFALPLKGTFGNLGRNVLIGPGLTTIDLSAVKDFSMRPLGEGGRLQLRVEAFNLLNRANFNLPARILFNGASQTEQPIGTAGRINSTTTFSRQIQLALRLSW